MTIPESNSFRPKITGHELEETSKVLEALTAGFSKQSAEHKAIELAAKAMMFVFQRGMFAEFKAFAERLDADLTNEQRMRLQKLGLQP